MKITASLVTVSLFLCAPDFAPAQTQEPPKEQKVTPPQDPPAPAPQGDKQKEPGKQAPKEKAKDECGGCTDGQMVPAGSAPKKVDLEKGMKLKDATLISDILAAPEKFEGKRVLVKGPAVGVCEKRGCWVTLKSDKDAKKALRVKVEDGEIVFPATVLGKEVAAEGVWEKMVIPVETLRTAAQKAADAKGEKFDPASIKEPRIVWQLKGLGAKFDK